MTHLTLVRHGQTAWNIEGRWQGHADIPLNPTGVEQARLIADELAPSRFTAIYSSDLQRALVTAQAIADRQGLPVKTNPGLRELNLGDWEGSLVSEIHLLYPDDWAERLRNPVDARPARGESVREVSERVIRTISAICAENPPEARLVIVSHGLSLAVFLCHIYGWPLAEAFEHIPHNARPLELDWSPAVVR